MSRIETHTLSSSKKNMHDTWYSFYFIDYNINIFKNR